MQPFINVFIFNLLKLKPQYSIFNNVIEKRLMTSTRLKHPSAKTTRY